MPTIIRHVSCFALCTLLMAVPALAQRGLKDVPKPDPDFELKSFKVAPGFEANLFADSELLHKPIQMNFDARGRLWIASSEVYPQIKPGQVANDKVLVLEDTDGDGRADKTTVFAQGLLIPTAVIPDASGNGCYVANSTEILYFQDTDGDGKADKKRIMLSGFGTEDTHHILHTFRWGVDGMLYMNQSIYIHSHIETPYGPRRANGGAVWHFRPETMQLEVFFLGLVNSWGHHQDYWGQSFATDGAGGEGINFVFPGSVFMTSPGARRILHGLNPGQPKHCGLEIVSSRHLPDDWQGTYIANDFRGNRVNRFIVSEDGSGYASKKTDDVIATPNVAFRPIDTKIGPDGAIYIADWYNPIIQHGEVDFRDERRDHTNGRVWRITAKGRPLVKKPAIIGASTDALLALLTEHEDFTRLHAKLQLRERMATGDKDVPAKIAAWVKSLDPNDSKFEHHRLEALWAYQTIDVVEPGLLAQVLRSKEPRARAAATRVVYHWHARLSDPLALLTERVNDDHPRVRLEAVNALRQLDSLPAAEAAMQALDRPVDQFIDFALWLTARELQSHWLPQLQAGKAVFNGNVNRLTFALKAAESAQVVGTLVALLKDDKVEAGRRGEVTQMVAALGGPGDLRFVFDEALEKKSAPLLDALFTATQQRNVKPAGDLSGLAKLIDDPRQATAVSAARLAGLWKLEAVRPTLTATARDAKANAAKKQAAFDALSLLGGPASKSAFTELAAAKEPLPTRMMAAVALSAIDLDAGAAAIAGVMADMPDGTNPAGVIAPLLAKAKGPDALAKALTGKTLKPDVAKMAMRTLSGSSREEPALIQAIMNAGGLTNPKRTLSDAELAAFIDDVQKKGNPSRGEALFRRDTLSCLKCHSIGGAGGLVGPDLSSIGASAPIDYLIESMLEPAKKVKEGYNAMQVTTKDDEILAGILVRKTDKDLLLRTSDDREIAIPLNTIASQKDAPSLMPAGLIDALTRDELVDLISFLSKLGKDGAYNLGKQRLIRTWRTPIATDASNDAFRHSGVDIAPKEDPAVIWSPLYSQVSGAAPWDATTKMWMSGPRYGLLRAQVSVTTAGKIALKPSTVDGLKLWVGANEVTPAATTTLDLPTGTHTLTFAILEGKNAQGFTVELVDVEGSPARAQVVGGK
jgi:putative heme-binding domain-containing protein